MSPYSEASSSEFGTTLAFEVERSPFLVRLSAACHVLVGLAVFVRWEVTVTSILWILPGMVAAFAYTHERLLTPGRGPMPRWVRITREGEWRLDGDSAYLVTAWVTPWLCRIVLAPTRGGRRRLWLARDAVGASVHWSLRRLLVQAEASV